MKPIKRVNFDLNQFGRTIKVSCIRLAQQQTAPQPPVHCLTTFSESHKFYPSLPASLNDALKETDRQKGKI